ncbi:hypothetical protein EXIGLDRAFT_721407 [Exidia glandulosa HHB12029]|uniref:ATP synthase complex subunit H n=1 Tax=Exidia glandulosa HHB12029 TaxID=1314781 RepID=A0A165FSR0_EXIGL|nr:hypothetical protein EXIGLDRAFT_721407 [Exidia glandulosa HHB12029]
MLGRVASASLRQTRKISTTAVARKDLVQDLYIREIKSYKPAPAVKDAHVGAVKDFAAPSAPKAPELPSNFAAELAAYDAANPDLADAPAAVATHAHADEGSVSGAPAFLAFLEADAEKPHHAEH